MEIHKKNTLENTKNFQRLRSCVNIEHYQFSHICYQFMTLHFHLRLHKGIFFQQFIIIIECYHHLTHMRASIYRHDVRVFMKVWRINIENSKEKVKVLTIWLTSYVSRKKSSQGQYWEKLSNWKSILLSPFTFFYAYNSH